MCSTAVLATWALTADASTGTFVAIAAAASTAAYAVAIANPAAQTLPNGEECLATLSGVASARTPACYDHLRFEMSC